MIRIVHAPHQDKEYTVELSRYWQDVSNEAIPEYREERVKKQDDGTSFIPWKQATHLMHQQMAVFAKVNGGGEFG